MRATFDRPLGTVGRLGPVREEAKKTPIRPANGTAFAGVAARNGTIIQTLKWASGIPSPRIVKHERVSANRRHLDLRLESPDEIDESS